MSITLEKKLQMQALVKAGLSKKDILETVLTFLKALNRFQGTEFLSIFNQNKTYSSVSFGGMTLHKLENVSKMELGRWKKRSEIIRQSPSPVVTTCVL